MFALCDANNFYASCETLFRPDIRGRPIIVLSNNDGCVVARSAPAKALGIKMGEPVFRLTQLIKRHQIVVFSSNYTLYADISIRIMQTLEELAPRVEIYSIDEAFMDISGVETLMSLEEFGRSVRQRIASDIGMPVCVGIGPTKTLAKLANYAAKKYPASQGVIDLSDRQRQRRLMQLTPVDEVWGVGGRLTARLGEFGIKTALDLADASPKQLRKHFSVVLEKTISELNGQSCLALEQVSAPNKQIVCSRSFGEPVTSQIALGQMISGYVARAAEKLRGQNLGCEHLQVFIRSSPFRKEQPQYSNAASGQFPAKTSDTRHLTACAMSLLDAIYKPGIQYAKAGVMLSRLSEAEVGQADMFQEGQSDKSQRLMSLVDQINGGKHGKAWFASQGRASPFCMKSQHRSPPYTTSWSALPVAK